MISSMIVSTTRLAKIMGVTSETIRRWTREGKYEFTKTHGGHLRITYNPGTATILYARVSSKKQVTSIEKQKELLENDYPNCEFLYDIGSGFNFKRRNFIKLLERVLSGEAIRIVVTTPDRFSRAGLTLLVKIIEFYGGEIVFLEDDNKTESFDTATLLSFLTSFCNSQSGKRAASRYKKDKDLSEG